MDEQQSESTDILLVEDNQDDEELTLMTLERCKLCRRIDVVRDGSDALDYVFATGSYEHRSGKDLPRLVLLDIKLPRVDGIEVLRQVKRNERTRSMPVIVLTSSRHEGDLINSYNLGADSFINKPLTFDQFCDAIGKIGMDWTLIDGTPL